MSDKSNNTKVKSNQTNLVRVMTHLAAFVARDLVERPLLGLAELLSRIGRTVGRLVAHHAALVTHDHTLAQVLVGFDFLGFSRTKIEQKKK
jgi:hypothetical protein